MKSQVKHVIILFLIIVISLLLFLMLNLKVAYYQGINYQVSRRQISIGLKIVDFYSRHMHYRMLVDGIIKDAGSEEDKILKLFNWTHENIRPVPEGFPIVDDHVLNIIIRGYGTDDQSSDVFATLCTYAGFPAGWAKLYPKGSDLWHAVAIVYFKDKKIIFDPYAGNYFLNSKKEFATIKEISEDRAIIEAARHKPQLYGIEYVKFFNNILNLDPVGIRKSQVQHPCARIKYWIENKFQKGS